MDRNEYLEIVAAQIRCKRAVPYLKEELADHIEDQKEAYIVGGMNPFEAEMAAVREMGDPVETGVELDRVHRPKMDWQIILGVLLMSMIGMWIQLLITKGYAPNETFFWYVSAMDRQLIGTGLGVTIMLAAYYLDYTLLIKWAFPCWMTLQILIVGLCFYGVDVNGRSYQAMHIAYFVVPFLAGIVYKFRTQRVKGLIKSIICIVISVLTTLMIPDLASAVATTLCGLLIISIAVYKNWYQVDRKKVLIGIWGGVALVGTSFVGKIIYILSQGETSYKIERLKAWIQRESWDYMINHVAETAENVKEGIAMEGIVFENIRNDYVWAYLFEYLGTWKGVMLLLAFVIFLAVLLRGVFRQKNRLGYIVGIGCVMYLGIQAFIYIGMNFQIVPIAGNFMPFFSQGITPVVVSFFYMGILLSVFRNSNVVRN